MTSHAAYVPALDASPVPALSGLAVAWPPPDTARALDTHLNAAMAKAWSGISPISLTLACADWGLHLLSSPGSQVHLARTAMVRYTQWLSDTGQTLVHAGADGSADADARTSPAHSAEPDSRFDHPAWRQWPWQGFAGASRAWEGWWHEASDLPGMRDHSREQMRFYGRQMLDVLSPSNCLLTNPQALQAAWASGGKSLLQGMNHALEELRQRHGPLPQQAGGAAPGQGLAMTPGQVVWRNHLIELIQYEPTTPQVHQTPVLIVPSCIMKYYILDLSPHNSMVRWLVAQGHTVFIISWRNPDEHDALLGLDDYVREGVLQALNHVHCATGQAVHLAGYCLGGTFAAIAAAALKGARAQASQADKANGRPLASLTLLAAETDFSEPGEMGVLIDEAQVRLLEEMMAEKGFLTGRQMAGSFQFLHSRELVWSSRTRRWLLGEDEVANDLMVWNADVTRLPAVMHSQYLRRCFLRNELAQGHFVFDGLPLSLRDIRIPVFGVGTVKDHVSPWKSVYKVHRLVSSPVTFVLTSGGHNAGIVSEPGHQGRHFQLLGMAPDQPRLSPQEWQAAAPRHEGSWWSAWSDWLAAQGSGRQVAARQPPVDAGLGAAPGQYVRVRYGD